MIVKLIGTITKLKIGETEFEFASAVIDADKGAKKVKTTILLPEEINKLLSLNPRMAVVDAFIKLELVIRSKASVINVSVNEKGPIKTIIWDLQRLGYIAIEDLEQFNKLNHIRNGVMHSGAFSGQIDSADAAVCVNLTYDLIQKIDNIKK